MELAFLKGWLAIYFPSKWSVDPKNCTNVGASKVHHLSLEESIYSLSCSLIGLNAWMYNDTRIG
jgi:hypothetical protein